MLAILTNPSVYDLQRTGDVVPTPGLFTVYLSIVRV